MCSGAAACSSPHAWCTPQYDHHEGLPLLGSHASGRPSGFGFCLFLFFAGTSGRVTPPVRSLLVLAHHLSVVAPSVFIAHACAFFWTWMSIFMIPMAKVNREAILLLTKPYNLDGMWTFYWTWSLSLVLSLLVLTLPPPSGRRVPRCRR